MKVFIDSDVILDVLMGNDPRRMQFFKSSALVLDLAERGMIDGITSSIILLNVQYISKNKSGVILDLLDYLKVIPTTQDMLREAFRSSFKDKEDAVQYITAKKGHAKYILTRNGIDYAGAEDISVITPADFLNLSSVKPLL